MCMCDITNYIYAYIHMQIYMVDIQFIAVWFGFGTRMCCVRYNNNLYTWYTISYTIDIRLVILD